MYLLFTPAALALIVILAFSLAELNPFEPISRRGVVAAASAIVALILVRAVR